MSEMDDDDKKEKRTCTLLLLAQRRPQLLDRLVHIVFFFLRILYSLVTLSQQALQPPDLREQPTPNLEREFLQGHIKQNSTDIHTHKKPNQRTDIISSMSSILRASGLGGGRAHRRSLRAIRFFAWLVREWPIGGCMHAVDKALSNFNMDV
jgi:hypothetical protein